MGDITLNIVLARELMKVIYNIRLEDLEEIKISDYKYLQNNYSGSYEPELKLILIDLVKFWS